MIQITEQASDDVWRRLNEGSRNTTNRLSSFHTIAEALKNNIEQPEQWKLFLFWQEQSKKIIKDLQEIDKMPLNITLNDTNRFAVDKYSADPIFKTINEVKLFKLGKNNEPLINQQNQNQNQYQQSSSPNKQGE